MFLRKGLVFLCCLGLLVSCASTQTGIGTKDETSSLSREEAEAEWVSKVENVWSTKYYVGDEGELSDDYWLTSADVSDALLKNGYYSQVERNESFQMIHSRGFCGESSYDDVIAENIGSFFDGESPRATSTGFINIGGGEVPKLGLDFMIVSVLMTVFKVFQFKSGEEFSNDLYRSIQDKIASQSADRCSFQMRSNMKDGTKFGDYKNFFIRGWLTEKDLICARKPCLGPRTQKVESLLSKQGASVGGGFYLLQSNLTGSPVMRSVVFVPRPAENTLLLFEVISARNGYVERKMSGELAERHAALAAELSIAWLKKSARTIQLDQLDALYAKAQPLSENAVSAIHSKWSQPEP